MQSQNLYFLAIVPNGLVAGEVTAFKEYIARHYNSQRALKVMPHITLKAPFTIPSLYMGEIMGWFNNLNLKTTPFTLTLNGFGAFANKRNPVIYLQPEVSTPLQTLQEEVITGFEETFPSIPLQFTEKTYTPHMTIAYRDLDYALFEKAWAEFRNKEYIAQFEVSSVYLLQHDGTKWNIISKKAF